jgi:ABC-type polysaccharide/polyol phosphate transport system ATPase subunit
MLGIIGRNGAGKSTLLRLIGRLLRPDEGIVTARGRISGILELGAGFHGDLTGVENIYIAGTVGGLTRREVRNRIDSIVAFSELEECIDRPLRGYSSGMQMRLAFSVAIHVNPDILLVDEVLSVGDLAFQQKCLARIQEFKQSGCTIIVVSHTLNTVRDLCDTCIWLDNGRVRSLGDAAEVVDKYADDAMAMQATTWSS